MFREKYISRTSVLLICIIHYDRDKLKWKSKGLRWLLFLNISDTKHGIVFVSLPTCFHRCVRGWDSSGHGKFKIFKKTNEKEKEQRKKQRKEE